MSDVHYHLKKVHGMQDLKKVDLPIEDRMGQFKEKYDAALDALFCDGGEEASAKDDGANDEEVPDFSPLKKNSRHTTPSSRYVRNT